MVLLVVAGNNSAGWAPYYLLFENTPAPHLVVPVMDQFRDKARLAGEGDTISEGSEGGAGHGGGKDYVYNSSTGEFLGRTATSWTKLICFYFLFTSILALLWGLCMGVFFQTLDFYIPKYSQESGAGVLSANPGLGFRPRGGLGFHNEKGEDSAPSIYSSLVWFRHGANGNWQQLKEDLDIFLGQYEPGFFANQGASLTKCSFETDPLSRLVRGDLFELNHQLIPVSVEPEERRT